MSQLSSEHKYSKIYATDIRTNFPTNLNVHKNNLENKMRTVKKDESEKSNKKFKKLHNNRSNYAFLC
jgi:hypothetical protein